MIIVFPPAFDSSSNTLSEKSGLRPEPHAMDWVWWHDSYTNMLFSWVDVVSKAFRTPKMIIICLTCYGYSSSVVFGENDRLRTRLMVSMCQIQRVINRKINTHHVTSFRVTHAGIELMTFRSIIQCPNHLSYHMPQMCVEALICPKQKKKTHQTHLLAKRLADK